MKAKLVIAIIGLFVLQSPGWGQCNDNLVEVAMAQSGKEALFIREFKVKLKKGSTRNPVPSAKYNVYLKENNLYRFNIESDKESGSEAILQLFDNGKCVGSSYDIVSNLNPKAFEFRPSRTGGFLVIISFRDGKPGCAAGIMSLINVNGPDTLVKTEKISEMETLFLNVENPVTIITDKELTDTMVLEIDNGIVYHRFDNYFIKPTLEGFATLRVKIKDEKGRLKDEAKSDFLVRRLPIPVASIHGMQGGAISRSSLQLAEALNIDSPVDFERYGYKIVSFVVRFNSADQKPILNQGEKFGHALKSTLSGLAEESRITIESILVKKPDGELITLEPLAFIVR